MRLAIIAINVAVITGIASLLTGCGLTQTVSESTVSLTKSIFYKEIKTLHLDFLAREAVNKNAQGIALSTVVRIYQLKDRKAFDSANYQSLFAEDSTVVKADLVAQKDIRVRPGESVTLDIPLETEAQYIAVAGMFISPEQSEDSWRVVLSREDLDPDKARIIELKTQGLALMPLEDE
ncbi:MULTISPECIES: type VI secretion system lipoprotein TssJ [Citrobacter]|jgi:type VI secretion system protein VasD|uniref:Type VI secretion system lipoprotein TssJ n=1 Tax=Citrobacter freundii TaxID=546 RepID=A0AAE7L0G8_CITFR|nr:MULTISPECIES: type VI secretion system lipoprotein TssJ [Citrobacter]ATF47955.1 type VI secretion system lipoprotein TssJ [Citrobacter werkmanii]MBD0828382.1 type VI secretion system lipoprotein TssJ [Citrobacter sp. C1]MCS3463593.1 type VI secretion system protein VasD [Citrobacter sp. JUb117]QLO15583.1 type VI secretion system lipoprotein TssJ [Citrobacter freundii]QMF20868.1 type VI secretion system lipoprotein TssJ [Citrobacter freundii]